MFGVVLAVHVLVCLVLIVVILIQGGRGGLSETLSGSTAQSLFGSSVTSVITRFTAGCVVAFAVTCLSLAYLSTKRGRSVIDQVPPMSNVLPQTLPFVPSADSPAPEPSVPHAASPAAPAHPTTPAASEPAH